MIPSDGFTPEATVCRYGDGTHSVWDLPGVLPPAPCGFSAWRACWVATARPCASRCGENSLKVDR